MLKKFIAHLHWGRDTVPSDWLIYPRLPLVLLRGLIRGVTLTATQVACVMTALAVVDTQRFLMHLVAVIAFIWAQVILVGFQARVRVVRVHLFATRGGVIFGPLNDLFVACVLIG
jgi:hypothetical protein